MGRAGGAGASARSARPVYRLANPEAGMPMEPPSPEPMSISPTRAPAPADARPEPSVPVCVICTLPLEPQGRPRAGTRAPSAPYRLACAHVMHRQCLLRSVQARGSDSGLVSCPLCRDFTLQANLENDMPAGRLSA